tara:strand:- start:4197 stop:5486 length:1290 start_codon:yes stop_codon:yes gene_type:complete
LFICDDYNNYTFSILEQSYNFAYPTSLCDDKVYYSIAENFLNLFTEKGSQYQSRPLYVFLPFAIHSLFKNFSFLQEIGFIFELSFLISQFLISVFTLNILVNILKKYYEIKNIDIFSISLIYFMNPVQQFVMFTTSNGTLSFTMLVLTIYFLEKYLNDKNIISICFLIGILFLANRSFIVSLIVFLIIRLFTKKINSRSLLESFIGFIVFWIPIYIYRLIIRVNGFEIADTNVVDYGQFIWVSKYFNSGIGFWASKFILSKDNFDLRLRTNWDSKDEWYCQSIPENFICYFEDLRLSSVYLFTPLILIILNILFSKKLDKSLYKNFIITSFITMFFWSFIGWFPPLRFGLYSYGNIIALLLIFYFSSFNNFYIKITYLLTLLFGLLNISHWNNPNLIEITYLDNISFVFLIVYLYLLFKNYRERNNEKF